MKRTTLIALALGLASLQAAAQTDRGFEIAKNLEIFSSVYKSLNQNYVDDVDPGKTIKVAIDAMLGSLDPYTNYYAESDIYGYIKLDEFTTDAAKNVREAFVELKKENPDMKGFMLDLRGNGGGLMNEAVDIVNIWVPKGTLVVETKGKVASKNTKSYTRMAPEDTEIPVAVLIDNSSASASEIVSGSLQDLDRAVIVGQRSFGKGLVQNILPMPYNSQMKVTVSKYYIPSGRCIQAIDYSHRDDKDAP